MGNEKIKVAVCGACGKMGMEVVKTVLNQQDMELIAVIDIMNVGKPINFIINGINSELEIKKSLEDALVNNNVDVVVDFTAPDSVYRNSIIALNNKVRPIIGTTGLTQEQLNELKNISTEKEIGMLIAPNFAVGAVLMMMFAQTASKYFEHAEIIELHHNRKKDAPSGTAIKTAILMEESRKEFGKDNIEEFESIKGSRGGVTASNIHIHSVRLPGFVAHQEVIFGSQGEAFTIRHDSFDRVSFMPGVALSIRHVAKNNDFVFGLENILQV